MRSIRLGYALLATVLCACGGSDEGSDNNTSDEKTPAPSGKQESVSVGGDSNAPEDVACEGARVSDELAELETQMLELVNEARAVGGECGGNRLSPSPPLRFNAALVCAARLHSQDMAENGYFDHNSPDGSTPFERMEAAGYDFRAAAENIATGGMEAQGVFGRWMNSPGHCSNILGNAYEDFGVGLAQAEDGTVLWTQTFGATF